MIGKHITDDLTTPMNNVYQINRDVSGWSKTTLQVVTPLSGAIYLYGTLDSGANNQNTQGNASLAINYTPIQATDLSTGSAVTKITGAGMFMIQADNQQFLRFQGNPAGTGFGVYRILEYQTKTT